MWNNERGLGIFLTILGAVGVYGSLQVPLSERFTLGPGALPLAASLGIIIFALIMVIKAPKVKDGSFKAMWQKQGKPGTIFVLAGLAFAAGTYFLGFGLCLFLFSLFILILVGRWKFFKATLFSVIWAVGVYFLFVEVLKVPLEQGLLFNLLK